MKMMSQESVYSSEKEVEVKLLHPLFRDVLGYSENDLCWDTPVKVTFGRETKTKWADLVVKYRKKPMIAVEAKKPTESVQSGMGQVDSYAFALETPYSVITNGRRFLLRGYYSSNRRFNVVDGTVDGLHKSHWRGIRNLIGIDAIPKSIKDLPNPVAKPSEDKIKDYRRFFRKIHNAIRDHDKLDPAAAFDELSKLLFLKAAEAEWIRKKSKRIASILTPERIEEWEHLGKRKAEKYIQDWFADATEELFAGVFDDHPKINLSPRSLKVVLGMMKPFQVKNGDVDVKGRAFEEFLPSQLRGKGLGQYFTPRPIVNFMATMSDVSIQDVVVDFACGSGGFLIKAFEQMKRGVEELPTGTLKRIGTTRGAILEDITSNQLFGIDAEPRAARTAKMNMLMWGDGRKVVRGNALDTVDFSGRRYEPEEYDERKAKSGCTLILANPPFGSKEKDDSILRNYVLGSKLQSRLVERTEVLFLEKGIKLLRPEGRMLIVIPQGLISGQGNRRVRDFIHSEAEIRAIISLPTHTFVQSGVPTVNTCILYVQKFTKEKKRLYDEKTKNLNVMAIYNIIRTDPDFNYPIFMGTAEFIGYEPSGRMIVGPEEETDLDLLAEDFRNQAEITYPDIDVFEFSSRYYGERPFRKKDQTVRGTLKGLKTSFVVPLKDTVDRLDPAYYLFRHQAGDILGALTPLEDSLQEVKNLFRPTTDDELDQEYSLLSVSSDGKVTLKEYSRGESLIQDHKKNYKLKRVQKNDIVYNPMRVNVGSIGVVPAKLDGGFVSPDYVVFRSKRVSPDFLVTLLRTPFYRMCIDVASTGSIRDRLYFRNLRDICVPEVTTTMQGTIAEQVRRIEEALERLLTDVSKEKAEAMKRINHIVMTPKTQGSKGANRFTTNEDRRDAEIAQERIKELKSSPEKILRGNELSKRMKRWTT